MTGKVKCLVVDDEPLARELIETHLKEIKTLEHVASCDNAMKAFEVLNTQQVDLLFLDIQMPLISGLDFLKSLKHPPKVIITTAFRNYALEGYELDVIDYLLKPITFQRFLKAIEKYNHFSVTRKEVEPALDFVYLKSNKKHFKIYTADILYIESMKDYITVYAKTNKLVLKQPISEIENLLPAKQFLRIHRSYIVNIKNITAFTASDVEINGKELPIGNSYKDAVLGALQPGKV